MKINLYRHAEPTVSSNETIRGCDFISWVRSYNESGVIPFVQLNNRSEFVYSSTFQRSIETAEALGEKIIEEPLLCEAEIPLIRFPPLRIKAKYWLAIARILWLIGFTKNCQSFQETKIRVRALANKLEQLQNSQNELTLVGHGLINRLLKSELKKRGWQTNKAKQQNKFLGKTTIIGPTSG